MYGSAARARCRMAGGLAVLVVVFTQYDEWHGSGHSWAGRASFVVSVGLIAARKVSTYVAGGFKQ